ncbi:hypothetical protein [Nannocystis sp. SCPEA4]|uniref:hypothetical protein n=1 Tax=Nannocystis sp. SCPEA4 TaxID=2996787 RepID=UPI00226E11BD|nr:hypothetical protein [Nannocystis sp. SCPEA4]MCY1055364.1 hypothetical protein [Nannocystis sp. SCPEA4]
MKSLRINLWCGLLLLPCACAPDSAKTTEDTTATEPAESTTTTGPADSTTMEPTTEPTTSTTTSTTSETTGPTGGEECPLDAPADQCCCFADAPGCESPTVVMCEAVVACDDIVVVASADQPVLQNPEALECALTALRDRTPGQIRVISHWGDEPDPKGPQEWAFLYLRDDGSVFEQSGANADDVYTSELVRRSLQSPEVFEQCLLEADPFVQLECIEKVAFGEPLETCSPMCGIF